MNFDGILPHAIGLALHLSNWRALQESFFKKSQMIIIETYSCVFALHKLKSNILEII